MPSDIWGPPSRGVTLLIYLLLTPPKHKKLEEKSGSNKTRRTSEKKKHPHWHSSIYSSPPIQAKDPLIAKHAAQQERKRTLFSGGPSNHGHESTNIQSARWNAPAQSPNPLPTDRLMRCKTFGSFGSAMPGMWSVTNTKRLA